MKTKPINARKIFLYSTVIDYRIEILLPTKAVTPSILGLALELFKFGLLQWINYSECKLKNTQKSLLHSFRLADYNIKKTAKIIKVNHDVALELLLNLGHDLLGNYKAFLHHFQKFGNFNRQIFIDKEYHAYYFLNRRIDLHDYLTPRSISQIKKNKIPSLYFLLLTNSIEDIREKKLLNEREIQTVFSVLSVHEKLNLWQKSPAIYSSFADIYKT